MIDTKILALIDVLVVNDFTRVSLLKQVIVAEDLVVRCMWCHPGRQFQGSCPFTDLYRVRWREGREGGWCETGELSD